MQKQNKSAPALTEQERIERLEKRVSGLSIVNVLFVCNLIFFTWRLRGWGISIAAALQTVNDFGDVQQQIQLVLTDVQLGLSQLLTCGIS